MGTFLLSGLVWSVLIVAIYILWVKKADKGSPSAGGSDTNPSKDDGRPPFDIHEER